MKPVKSRSCLGQKIALVSDTVTQSVHVLQVTGLISQSLQRFVSCLASCLQLSHIRPNAGLACIKRLQFRLIGGSTSLGLSQLLLADGNRVMGILRGNAFGVMPLFERGILRFNLFKRTRDVARFSFGRFARRRQFIHTVALSKSRSRRTWCIGSPGKTVPTPKVALARYKPLTGEQLLLQLNPSCALDNPDLRQTPQQKWRARYLSRQRFNALRQILSQALAAKIAPMRWRLCVG